MAAKTRFFQFLAPFWILTPSWISESKILRLKLIFGPILIVLHPKIVLNYPARWRYSQFLSKKMAICRHLEFWPPYWIFLTMLDFLMKIGVFLKIKPLTEWKNVLPLIFWNFSKIGLLTSAILVYAAILQFFQKSFSMIC